MQENSQLVRLQNEIRARYDSLSKRLKQVAQYVLDNHNSVVFDTVATISERAGVPPSTLIRFANAFGFSGFNEMKNAKFSVKLMEETASYTERLHLFRQLSQSQDQQESAVDILNIFAQSNHQALQQLANQTSEEQLQTTAVEILNQANNIFIVGLKRSFSIACYLFRIMRCIIWIAALCHQRIGRDVLMSN